MKSKNFLPEVDLIAVVQYLFLMKPTVDLPDQMLHRAKVVAAQRQTTLNALMVSGLEMALSTEATSDRATADLADILSVGHNRAPVGQLCREEIYDRPIVAGHKGIQTGKL